MLLYVLVALILFSLLIFLHELGHFIAAKACNVRVNEFSVFMGPTILSKTIGETTYSLRAIPIGGYCAMEGEEQESTDARAYSAAAVWKRFLILIAGALFNYLFAILLLFSLFITTPKTPMPVIESVEPSSTVAGADGLRAGDTILRIDGKAILRYSDVSAVLGQTDASHDLIVRRDGKKLTIRNILFQLQEFPNSDGSKSLRYGINFSLMPMTVSTALSEAWFTAFDFVKMIWIGLGDLIRGAVGLDQLSGAVGIVKAMAETGQSAPTVSAAMRSLLLFSAFLAANLAVTNLLPIPALDGGKAFTLLVSRLLEKLLRRKIDPRYEQTIHAVGMILLLLLIALITFKDILSIFRR